MKTATFSNGHRDQYKGKREVTAAWAIIDKQTGAVLMSGHSLDEERAKRTAEKNLYSAAGHKVDGMWAQASIGAAPAIKDAVNRNNQEIMASINKLVTIEVVGL